MNTGSRRVGPLPIDSKHIVTFPRGFNGSQADSEDFVKPCRVGVIQVVGPGGSEHEGAWSRATQPLVRRRGYRELQMSQTN